MKISWIEL